MAAGVHNTTGFSAAEWERNFNKKSVCGWQN